MGIRVYDAAGNLIGTGGATLNGTFTLTLNTAQLNGQHISVTAVAGRRRIAADSFLQATDITPPANPLVTGLSLNGLVLTGTGEAGATVTVRDASNNVLGTAVVNGGGVGTAQLNAAQLNGQVLGVSQADAAGNVGSTSYTATDVQPPATPTNVTINGAGTVLTGNGEAELYGYGPRPERPGGYRCGAADGTFTINPDLATERRATAGGAPGRSAGSCPVAPA